MLQFALSISILGEFVVAAAFGRLDEIGKIRIMEEN
jgi:hypothetical protein